MKKKNSILVALGLTSALITASLAGCGNVASDETTATASSTEAAVATITETEVALAETATTETVANDNLIYGTVNLPYADFYYGELNNIEPESAATFPVPICFIPR